MSYSIPSASDRRGAFEVFDDFEILAERWTAVNDGTTGAMAVSDAAGGILSIASAAADNDYHYLVTDNEVIRPAAGKSIKCAAMVKLTEAATNAANIVFGLSSVVDATLVANDGGGLTQANPGILLTKVDGGTSWIGAWSDGTTKRTQTLGAFASGEWVEIGFHLKTSSANDGTAELQFFIGATDYPPQRVALSGGILTEMHGAVGVKAGSTSAETLLVDWAHFHQVR